MSNKTQTKIFQTTDGPRTLHVGGTVRVLGVPLGWYEYALSQEEDESNTILERCVGRIYQVEKIDEFGSIWICCHENGEPCDDEATTEIWPRHYFRVDLLEIVDYGE